jgi:hypothetical protein
MFDATRAYLERIGLPAGDLNDLPDSTLRFADGGQFRVEVPTVNTPEAAEIILAACAEAGVKIDRLDQTAGGMLFTAKQHERYLELGERYDVEMCFGIGPRGMYDIGAQKLGNSVWAHAPAYRLRGMEQVVYATEDLLRLVELGARTLLIYDEGQLWLANRMRADGELPADVVLMASAHMGHNNPISYRVLEQIGADTVATQRDMELSMVASLRAAVGIPIHVHVDNPQATGGFIRTYEAAEMIRIGSPIFLKMGSSVLARHGMRMSRDEAEAMAIQVISTLEIINRVAPAVRQSPYSHADREGSRPRAVSAAAVAGD